MTPDPQNRQRSPSTFLERRVCSSGFRILDPYNYRGIMKLQSVILSKRERRGPWIQSGPGECHCFELCTASIEGGTLLLEARKAARSQFCWPRQVEDHSLHASDWGTPWDGFKGNEGSLVSSSIHAGNFRIKKAELEGPWPKRPTSINK